MTTGLVTELDHRGVLRLTLQRPDKSNALNSAMLLALHEALHQAVVDDQVRLLVLSGQGKHFCSGADTDAPPDEVKSRPVRLHQLCHSLYLCPKPMLAQVQGACLGAGLAMVAGCDWVLAHQESFFSLPEVRLGFAPNSLLPYLTRAVPARQLMPYVLSGARFDARQALAMGLVHRIAEQDQAPALMDQTIEEMLWAAPLAQTSVKGVWRELEHQTPTLELAESLQDHVDQQKLSPQALEAQAALKEKRRPNWLDK
ncbi:MAG: hypothetical protein RIT26_1049 [Pseudomonadota bacterium]